MTKYADVHKMVVSEDFTVFFTACETFNRMDDDYLIEDVEIASVEILGVEVSPSDLPSKLVDAFLELSDDDNTEWEYY
jgi:hypothetical protein